MKVLTFHTFVLFRVDFDGKPWPPDSPVSGVYDVKFTSTKMLILNNKYGKVCSKDWAAPCENQQCGFRIGPTINRAVGRLL